MTADGVRGLATNAGQVKQVLWHRGVSGDKGRTCAVPQKVTTRLGFDSDELSHV